MRVCSNVRVTREFAIFVWNFLCSNGGGGGELGRGVASLD